MEALRVGFFTEVYHPIVNGVVVSVDTLAGGLRERGHRVHCFAPHMPGERSDDRVVRMPSVPLPTPTAYRLTLPLLPRAVRDLIAELSVIHVHSPFVTGWTGAYYARRLRIPLVFTYHTQLEAYAHYVPFEPNATRSAATQLTRTFANRADAVIVPTAAMATRLRGMGVTARIEVVPSAVDVAHFAAGKRDDALRAALGVRDGDRLLLCVARLAREKNIELLFEALRHAADPSLRLAIAGDGPARGDLEAYARDCGVADQIVFLGEVERERLPDLYAGCDAFCMPSTTETQGLVQAEALAAGASVIAADAPQNRDVLGSAGTLVAPTPAGFAAALRAIPARPDPAAAQAARAAAGRFSVDAQVDRIVEIYRSLPAPLESVDIEHTFA